MSRYRFESATEADDADLRHILAATAMPGPIAVAFQREPSYFAGSVVEGSFRQVVACRDLISGRIVGFGSRSISDRWVNGERTPIGYLSNLRLLAEHRNRGLVARGYKFFRDLHKDGRTPFYLTTISDGNAPALQLLTSGRAGLPRYHFAGNYHTVVLERERSVYRSPVVVEAALPDDLTAILKFLEREGPRRQFFPAYCPEDFQSPVGLLRNLALPDILLAKREGELVGMMGAWDQMSFRRQVVVGYGGLLRWVRLPYNIWARTVGRPRLPPRGEPLRCLFGALPIVADSDERVFRSLLSAVRRRLHEGPWDYLLMGLHETDPLWPVLQQYRSRVYTTRLYLVGWNDIDVRLQTLDDRPRYLELGSL